MRSRLLVGALLVAVLAFSAAAFYLWRQNVALKARLSHVAPAAASENPAVRRVREGDQVPEFSARTTDGREVQVARRGAGNTLLFIYDPNCDRCEAAREGWSRVKSKLTELGATGDVFALSVADSYTTVQHARSSALPFAAVPFPSVELQKQYGATEVPLTVVVDAKGIVTAVWDKPLGAGEVGDVIETVCPECVKRAIARSF